MRVLGCRTRFPNGGDAGPSDAADIDLDRVSGHGQKA
jgi:hypothetical protein